MKKYMIAYAAQLTVIGALTTLLFVGISLPEVFPRAVHRLLHILGAIIFLGNIVVSALWFSVAVASRKNDWFAFAARLMNITDLVFTGPGLILLLWNATVLVGAYGNPLAVDWLKWALIYFSATGALWMGVLIPLQFRFMKQADAGNMPWNDAREQKLLGLYNAAGGAAVLLVILSLVKMVLK
ncbi:MAG TPA: DUF2269 family protein [Turneriella sp.]|nr:DUF2269 family protein [Turneriella sp.]